MSEYIEILGARIHNLKNIDVRIPRGKLTVITGVSGSGKSSLAFDTLYEEGKRRYLLYSGSQFMVDSKPMFDQITGLSPTVAVEQRITRQSNPRSTVGTRTKISNMLAMLFAAYGKRDPEHDDQLPLTMDMFQRNSPKGMCVKCLGNGVVHFIDEPRIFSNINTPIKDLLVEGILYRGKSKQKLDEFCYYHGLSVGQPLHTLSDEQLKALKYGDNGKTKFHGILSLLQNGFKRGELSGRQNDFLQETYFMKHICPKCNGTGLGEQAMYTTIADRTITDLQHMYIRDLNELLRFEKDAFTTSPLIHDIIVKLDCMVDVGLHHLSLSRPVPTLSGGEIQRLFLATFVIAEMESIIFIFDEPTIGLHEIEKAKLIGIIQNLVKRGNTVIAVEHDENFMRAADYIIDIGPDAGIYGGQRIFQGTFESFMNCEASRTAPYLASVNQLTVKSNNKQMDSTKMLTIENACLHNLRNVTVNIPLGLMVGIAGVSGSGKSSLISGTLVPKLKELLGSKNAADEEEMDDRLPSRTNASLRGASLIKKCLVIDQKPIGRTRTSCPATFTGIYDRIRRMYASTELAIELGYTPVIFSFNSEGGCSECKGDGIIQYNVGLGNYIELHCDSCGGTGFIEEAMQILIEGTNIRQVLEMSVSEALVFFGDEHKQSYDKIIQHTLQTLERVGLGYITLGQKTPTISGGESQRIKLAKELSKQGGKDCLYVMDEPTTGLSFSDTERLMKLILELTDAGNSVVVTEHDPAVLSNCDYIIEMGPGGGTDGGTVIAEGTPAALKQNNKSIIGRYLK
ncbi:excinuclease ABC, A subunit [Paenibacillaceae bacterium GAS479]|nr:excinuclease ABC, A subunit [Paenibacillaceae bacterium GAS479]